MKTSTDREISCRVTRTLLMYVREQNNGSLGALLDGLDLDEDYLLDTNNWVSHTFLHVLYHRMISILGDDNAVYKMALASRRFESLGLLDHLARLLGSPKLIYEQAPEYNKLLKLNGDVYIHELGKSWVVLEDRYHKSAQKTRYDCDYTRGVLTGIPTVFDMPPAQVEEIECQVAPDTYGKRIWPDTPPQGSRGCLYRVRWYKGRIPLRKRLFGRLAVYRKAIDDLQEANRRIQGKYDEVRRLASDLQTANRKLLESKRQLESNAADLLASEERYRFLAENVSDIIWTLTLENMRFEYISPSIQGIRGFTAEEAVQLSLEQTLSPQSLETVTRILAEELAREGEVGLDPGRHRTIELQQLGKDGSYAWAEARVSFIRNEKGRPVGVLGVTRDITERKRMEEELRRSRDELELRVQERTKELKHQAELLDLTHDAIVVRDLDGVIAFWNKGAEEMYGWTKEEAKGKIMRDLLQTQFPSPRDEIMAKIMQEGRWEGELTHTQKDGKNINVLSRWALQKSEEGKPTGVMHINHDITQRLRAEEALREREEMFRLFLEHSPIYVFFKDEQIRSMQLSKNYEKMLGRPIHELIGKTMNDLFPSELAKSMVNDDLRILNEKGKPIKVEEELNGRFYTTTKFPIIRQGKPPRLAGFTMDITEATLAERALREQEERFRTIFNAVSDAIFVQDLISGAIVDVNQRVCDMYGYTRDEALQLSIGTLCAGEPPYTEEHALKWIRKAAGGEPQVFEWRAKDKAGRLFWVEANMRRASIGGQDRLLVTIHDITEQKRSQAQILDQQRTLAMLNERELLARDLHDGTGQMLAAAHIQVKLATDLLARGDTASAESCLHSLDEVIQGAKESVREYLFRVKVCPSPEQSLLTGLRQYLNQYHHNFGINTELVVPPELEGRRFDSTVEAQLQPVIQEAMTNVRKHSGANSARVIFALCENQVRVSVEDGGRGFDPEGITEKQGFGLRSMRGRVETVGGRLELNSTPGKGTQLIIRVPLRKEET